MKHKNLITGGLPPAPETGNSLFSQLGEELMAKVEDHTKRFSILFVDNWTQRPGSRRGSIRSSQSTWYAEAEIITANGMSPEDAAEERNISMARSTLIYRKIANKTGNVHGLPAASFIYQYQKGTSPVTGKPLHFMHTSET